ncbi:2-dehydropantoate 2-reductase [Peribacillus psychrosaccharolyticus]|uniref:2-dehydropantoate 2-reductase n=1 Tax=Peribacillus psychrosaccharolyticus TaxID=1407 RepID=A0A974NRA3_PERPY|nr:2-dehydropantoate 2-reductase [Peribacillus psychrosaccharolyticus]MEC2057040.1 2-dehydropantoate 2-reductase [Peribacillus psychrosaccharolyticus]MED3744962.1 2-dehydropantoate 2-reductase [Peribacillus psychrosaccharolyticus]QQT02418.1 2-dehydropantoate 2-reductase [Peribacillus psychrosaccharolyticus]
MNIVIIGAGALGVYYGARWQESGQPVQFLVRERRARQIAEEGLYVTSPHGNYLFHEIDYTENVEDIENPDLILLSVKGHHLEGTLPALTYLVEKGAKILPILNGLEHIHILQQTFGEEAVMGGSAYIIATLNERGHVVHSSTQHDLVFGPLHPSQQELCAQIENISDQAIMDAHHSTQILRRIWQKYIFINAFSGVTTAANLNIGTIRHYPETFSLLKKVLIEMQQLAAAYDIEITDNQIAQSIQQLHDLPDEATSSMHQDRRKFLTLEVEHLQGGALRLASMAGIKLPVIETLYGIIKPFEN